MDIGNFPLRLEASNWNHKHAIILPPVYDFTDGRQHHLERRSLHSLGIYDLGETIERLGTLLDKTLTSKLDFHTTVCPFLKWTTASHSRPFLSR